MRRIPIKLSFKLPLLVVLAVTLTAVASSAVGIVVGRNALRAKAGEEVRERVDVYASAVKLYVDSARTVLETTAMFPSIQRFDPAVARDRARIVMQNARVFEYVMFLGRDGVVALLEPEALERQLSHRDLSFLTWYRDLLESGRTVVSDLHISPATQRPTVIIAVPVRLPGSELVGIWAGALKLGELSRLGRGASDPAAPGYAYVTDRRGLIIAHQARAAYVENQTDFSASPTVRAALAGQRGALEFVSPIDRETKIGGYRAVDELRWAAAYVVPVSHAFEPIDQLTRGIGGASMVLALIMACAGFVVAQRIVGPLRRLTAAARRMGSGEYSGRIDVRSADEIGQLGTAFNQMAVGLAEKEAQLRQRADELQKANRLKSEFLANMSHELRTPLNAIIGFSELMHDGKVGPVAAEQKEFLGDILTSSRHLLQLINDVLDLAKVESGKMEFQPEPVDAARVAGEVRDILRSLAAAKRIGVDVDVAPGIGDIVLDPGKLKQVLYNYLSNAIKFTPDGGRVTIHVMPEGDAAFRVEVEDTGIGIKQEDLARLFVEFQQLDASTNKKYPGTGLGLALTKRIVDAQGGHVGVRSISGQGSSFYAVLPLQGGPATGVADREFRPEHRWDGEARPTILVVEDDPADQRFLVATLTDAGYAVETAATGAVAIGLTQGRAFDAITLDLLLPDMGGHEVLRVIRSQPLNRETPVIVVTVVAEKGVMAGFHVLDILAKPVREDALLVAVARAGIAPESLRAVIVVDDDPQALKLAEVALHGAGYRTVCCRRAGDALRAIAEDPPAIVVLDLLMPEMGGLEFVRRLREAEVGRPVPVVLWTGKDLMADERAGLVRQVQGVVLKSDGTAGLLAEIQAHVAPSTEGRTR